jgi:hypothetical protein
MKNIHFDILNSLYQSDQTDSLKSNIKIKDINNIKKIYAEKCNFSLTDYSVIFCKNQCNLYETIIYAITESYTNIVGVPHIICSTMEHTDIISILNKLVKKSSITVSYVNTDVYGATPLNNVINHIKPNTALVIVSYINYVTGAKNDIKSLNEFLIKKHIPLFSDCIYTYGKLNVTNLPDIFSIDFTKTNISLLVVKNILIDGYKLKYHSELMQDDAEKLLKINDADYKQVMKSFLSQKFNLQILKISNEKILSLRNYLISCLTNVNAPRKVHYYNDIINLNIIPAIDDIVILAHETLENGIPNIISFIYMKHTSTAMELKLKKKNISIVHVTAKTFENVGLLPKWSKHVLTLSLDNCSKKDIDLLVSIL